MSTARSQTGAARPPLPVRILAWRLFRSGALRGFVSVSVGALKLYDVAVFATDGKAWVAMPTKPVLSGNTVARDASGRPRRTPVAEWLDRETARRFSDGAIAALAVAYPDALDGDEAGP